MATTTYVWSKVDLPDPATYYHGFKEARILSYGEINRSLSDDRGNYEGADFSFTASDTDRLIRGLMSGAATKYGFANRNVVVRMISDAGRRLLEIPRTIARGVTKQVVPLSSLQARFEMVDFVTSKFAGTNTNKQIPQRLWGPDFLGSPIEARKLAVPIIYGVASDEASATPPPIPDVLTSEGSYVWGGYYTAGNGPMTSTAAVPTGVNAVAAAGGTLSEDVPNSEYGVWVTAVDASGNETDPHIFYTGGPGDGRGSFAFGPIPGIPVDGTQKIQVSWNASAGAAKYRIYLAWWYFGARWQQWLEVTAPTTSCEFTAGPNWSTAQTLANITPGANPPLFQFFSWYAVMAVMPDGATAISQVIFGTSGPFLRPVRLRWLAVAGALEYLVVRRGLGTYDRQWTVPNSRLYFDDDLIDTGVTYLTGGVAQPQGLVPVTHLGQTLDDYGFPWETFGICGHAVKNVTAWFSGGQRVDLTTAGVDWLVPGHTGWASYFASAGTLGLYRDVNGRRYALLYARGPYGDWGKSGERPITVNVEGIEPNGDGTGAVITDLVQQYKHFVINFGFQNYQSGAYLTAPTWAPDDPTLPQVDEASFDLASTVAAQRIVGGYVGTGILGNKGTQETLREWMARFNLSANVDCGFNRNSQFFVTMLNDRFSVLGSALAFTQLQDILADSFSVTPQSDKHFNVHPYVYRRRWRDDTWEVENVETRDQTSIDGYFSELTAQQTDLWFVRDGPTALDVMSRRLMMAKDPPNLVTFQTPLVGFNTDLGDLVLVTHSDGLGAQGWTQRVCRIQRHAVNPNDFSLRMECLDVNRIFAEACILGDDTWAVTWTTATTTQRQYAFLCNETTGLFSDGEAGKRLR